MIIDYNSKIDINEICKATGYPISRFIAWQEKLEAAEIKGIKSELLYRQKKIDKKQAEKIQLEHEKIRISAIKDIYSVTGIDMRKSLDTRETLLLLSKVHGEFKIKRNLFAENLKNVFSTIKTDKNLSNLFFKKLEEKGMDKKNYINLTTYICKNQNKEYQLEVNKSFESFKKKIGVLSSTKTFEEQVSDAVLYDYLFKEVEEGFSLYHLHVFPEIFIILSSFSQAKRALNVE